MRRVLIVHRLLLYITLLVFFAGCTEELGPIDTPSGFSGIIRFRNWPPAQNIKEMRLVAMDRIPTDSASVIPMLLAGEAAVYPPVSQDYLPTLVDSVVYQFDEKTGTNLQVREYKYVAVWYQYGRSIFTDWRPAGVYTTSPQTVSPEPLRVILHRVTPHIDILVDFNNLPPMPWN
jgi:hypothetical protein